ncbi:AAA family ATPase [Paenibacillus sp. VCA1]|uniref:AAA family ATPase n=1 Tax=Paenibacillus sp. VCA1 TaxID=3039148 RepID=UPI0028717C96|nr:AAA family ATPase [Paenibacillus sp. VCA1]MDR9854316.1 AAA family ATPase [Paenibacillus sp. VCA1]
MNIERLQIHGFGRIRDRDIRLHSPITVLAGPNEAGKSTILHFVRAMLYGIPGRSYPTERFEPPGGGVHGGVLTAKAEDGSTWTVSRFASRDGGAASGRGERLSIVKTTAKGTAVHMTQGDLERELLGGLSRDMFKQLFAVTLTELQEIRTLQSEELGSYLFHAGFGGGADIVRAERRLLQEMEKLYKPRGRVQESAKVLQAIERLEREIAESRSYLAKYLEAESKLRDTNQSIAEADRKRNEASERLALLRKAQEIRPQWLEWKEASLELAGMPETAAFPEEGVQRWYRLQAELDRLRIRQQELDRASGALSERLGRLQPDEGLIRQGPLIERLAARRETIGMRMKELQESAGEEAVLQEQLHRVLRQMDPGWGVSELRAFSGSVSEREAVRRYAAGFAGYDRRMESLAMEREQKSRQWEAAEDELGRAEAALRENMEEGRNRFAMFLPKSKAELLPLWNDIQSGAERWRETRLERLSRQEKEEREAFVSERMKAFYRRLLWGSVLMTLLLPGLLLLLRSPLGAAAAFVLLVAADIFFWRESRGASPKAGRAKRRNERALHDPDREASRLSSLIASLVSDPLTASGLSGDKFEGRHLSLFSEQDMESALRELRKQVDAWLLWQDELEKSKAAALAARQRAEAQRQELSALSRKMDKEQRIFAELEGQWQEWLSERALGPTNSPETVMDLFGFAEQGLELVRRLEALGRKKRALEQEIRAYEEECLQVLPEDAASDSSPLLRLEAANRAWDEQKKLMREREIISSKLEPVQEEYFRIRMEIDAVMQSQEALLAEAQTEDGERFLRQGALWERRKELERSVRQLAVGMFSGWPSDREHTLRDMLDRHDAASLEAACRTAADELDQAERQHGELQQLRGRLLQERDGLVKLCAHDTALQQLEEQKALLKDIAAEYAVRSLCAELIARTRGIYEREKQPRLLQLASAYFGELTRGSYSRVVMKLGEKRLLAEHREAGLVDSTLLSRGTAEQLYLAMRFALAGSMEGHFAVPLLLDDLFVNFDEERMCSALGLAGKLAGERQIIMLTCHRYILDDIRETLPQADIIRI